MYYEVYIDAVFLTNLIMDYILLRLLMGFLKCSCPFWRPVLGAFCGAVGACGILLMPPAAPVAAVILLHGLLAVVMVKISCGLRSKSMLMQAVVGLYLTAFLCGGVWDVLARGRQMTPGIFLLFSGMVYCVLTSGTLLCDYWKMRTANLYKVRLNYQGKILCVKGLYDTGNQLTDLGSDRPVSIVTFQLLEQLLGQEESEGLRTYHEETGIQSKGEWRNLKPHFLTFQSAGNPSAVALAITVDDMCITGERDLVCIRRPVIAVPLNEFALPDDYQIILNGKLLE